MVRILFLLLLYGFSTTAFAVKRIVVLDFKSTDIESKLLSQLTEDARAGAFSAIKGRRIKGEKVELMTRENMLNVLKGMGKDASCIQGSCEVEIGRNIGADYVMTGEVNRFESTYILSIKIHNTDQGSIEFAGKVRSDLSLSLMDKATSLGAQACREALNLSQGAQGPVQSGESDWTATDDQIEHRVSFRSTPSGASVLVDGNLVCKETPCSRYLTEGVHDIQFEKQRYYDVSQTITVDKAHHLALELNPQFGWVSIETSPIGLPIKIDGQPFGTSPIIKKELGPGPHRLLIDDPCYQSLKQRFRVKAGQHLNTLKLPTIQPKRAGIKVYAYDGSDAVDGTILIDGTAIGTTGKSHTVPLCSKKVAVQLEDGRQWSRPLRLKEEKTERLEARFEDRSALPLKKLNPNDHRSLMQHCNNNNAEACYMLANSYSGLRAKTYYQKACSLGLGDACKELGQIDKALKIYQDKCSHRKNGIACLRLATWMCKKVDCIHPNEETKDILLALYGKACEYGQQKGCLSKRRLERQRSNKKKLKKHRRATVGSNAKNHNQKKKNSKANRYAPRTGLGLGGCFGIGGECIGMSAKIDFLAGNYSVGLTGNGVVNGVNFRWHPVGGAFAGYSAHFLFEQETASMHSLSFGWDLHMKESYLRFTYSHNYSPNMTDFPENSGSISWMFRMP